MTIPDIQLHRKLEQFLELLNYSHIPVSQEIYFFREYYFLLAVKISPDYSNVTCTGIAPLTPQSNLKNLLQLCSPAHTGGVIMKGCIAGDNLVLTCMFPAEMDAFYWFRLLTLQHKFLIKCAPYV